MNLKERIKSLCKNRGISMNKLEEELGFAKGYVSKLDKSNPNSSKLQKIADYFNVSLDYLISGEEKENETYYLNEEARENAQFLFENPEYRALFDASRKVKPEDIEFVAELLAKFSKE